MRPAQKSDDMRKIGSIFVDGSVFVGRGFSHDISLRRPQGFQPLRDSGIH